MKDFPLFMKPENKEKFPALVYNRHKLQLRKDLYKHITSHAENDYFSIDKLKEATGDMATAQKLIDTMIPELEKLGWKCKKSYGDTALFIYSTEQPPPNCW